LPLSCEVSLVIEKGDFAPRFLGGRDTLFFGHAFSIRTHFRAPGQYWLSSIQRARWVADEKQKIESR